MKKVMNFFKQEDGQGMVEYGLIIALVAIVLIGALALLSGKEGTGGIKGIFKTTTDELADAGTTTP